MRSHLVKSIVEPKEELLNKRATLIAAAIVVVSIVVVVVRFELPLPACLVLDGCHSTQLNFLLLCSASVMVVVDGFVSVCLFVCLSVCVYVECIAVGWPGLPAWTGLMRWLVDQPTGCGFLAYTATR